MAVHIRLFVCPLFVVFNPCAELGQITEMVLQGSIPNSSKLASNTPLIWLQISLNFMVIVLKNLMPAFVFHFFLPVVLIFYGITHKKCMMTLAGAYRYLFFQFWQVCDNVGHLMQCIYLPP